MHMLACAMPSDCACLLISVYAMLADGVCLHMLVYAMPPDGVWERTGEWFCPRCQKELGHGDSTALVHSSLHTTPYMKQEDCHRSLAAALGTVVPCADLGLLRLPSR